MTGALSLCFVAVLGQVPPFFTHVGGPRSGTWTGSDSPYLLVDEVTVPPGKALRLDPSPQAGLFTGGSASRESCDVNDAESTNLADVIDGVLGLFQGDPLPPPPHVTCGMDYTTGPLGGISATACP